MSQPEPDAPARFANREVDAADMRALEEFIAEAQITEVLNVVKSGKEATVYRCRAHHSLGVPYVAANVYHSQAHRTFQRAMLIARQQGATSLESRAREELERAGHSA